MHPALELLLGKAAHWTARRTRPTSPPARMATGRPRSGTTWLVARAVRPGALTRAAGDVPGRDGVHRAHGGVTDRAAAHRRYCVGALPARLRHPGPAEGRQDEAGRSDRHRAAG